ncbi:unnamed protein product, partial [Chrysoparadoxa australica]
LEGLVQRSLVGLLAIDEAHCISTWGNSFRPSYLELGAFRKKSLTGVPVLALTASASEEVVKDILAGLGLGQDCDVVRSSFDRPNIHLSVRYKDAIIDRHGDPETDLMNFLGQRFGETGIIYCHKRDTCEQLSQQINSERNLRLERSLAYHGKMSHEARRNVLARWLAGDCKWVCATVAFGMGINNEQVRFVVHWDAPATLEGLYQELGRAGRDGKEAVSLVYHSIAHCRLQSFLLNKECEAKALKLLKNEGVSGKKTGTQGAAQNQEKLRMKSEATLEAVFKYCEGEVCRRATLLSFFGESSGQNLCKQKGCDVCESKDVTLQQIAVMRRIKLHGPAGSTHGKLQPQYNAADSEDDSGEEGAESSGSHEFNPVGHIYSAESSERESVASNMSMADKGYWDGMMRLEAAEEAEKGAGARKRPAEAVKWGQATKKKQEGRQLKLELKNEKGGGPTAPAGFKKASEAGGSGKAAAPCTARALREDKTCVKPLGLTVERRRRNVEMISKALLKSRPQLGDDSMTAAQKMEHSCFDEASNKQARYHKGWV